MASTEIFIFSPNPATSQAVAVVPMLAPNINPKPPARLTRPALINEMVITETKELDCIKAVVIAPKVILLYSLFVAFLKTVFKGPLVKTLNPSSNVIIPNKSIDTPAAIVLKLGLKNKTIPKTMRTIKKIHRLIIKVVFQYKLTNNKRNLQG